MKAVSIFVFILLCTFNANAQSGKDPAKKKDGEYMLQWKAAYHKQKKGSFETGLFFGIESHLSSWGGGTMYGPSVSCEFLRSTGEKSEDLAAPKIGFEAYNANIVGIPWGARCNFTYYTFKKNNSLKLTPEFGLSIWSFVNVFYGYTIPLTNSSLIDNNGHTFTAMLNIPIHSEKYRKWHRK
jgi:hypothetical protein